MGWEKLQEKQMVCPFLHLIVPQSDLKKHDDLFKVEQKEPVNKVVKLHQRSIKVLIFFRTV